MPKESIVTTNESNPLKRDAALIVKMKEVSTELKHLIEVQIPENTLKANKLNEELESLNMKLLGKKDHLRTLEQKKHESEMRYNPTNRDELFCEPHI